MSIAKEHAAKYTVRKATGVMVGTVHRQGGSWFFKTPEGMGPKSPRVSPASALSLAAITGFTHHVYQGGMPEEFRKADEAFARNVQLSVAGRR